MFDNVNFQKRVRHERAYRHVESWNFTSRLAVKVAKLPPPEVVAMGDRPQKSRADLAPLDLLPSDEDDQAFLGRAQLAVLKVLTTHFPSFKHLQHLIQDQRSDYTAIETEIHPLALMDMMKV